MTIVGGKNRLAVNSANTLKNLIECIESFASSTDKDELLQAVEIVTKRGKIETKRQAGKRIIDFLKKIPQHATPVLLDQLVQFIRGSIEKS